MRVAPHPLHRSGRAELPHPAPTLGNDAKPRERVRMTNVDTRNPSGHIAAHSMPGQIALAAASEHTPPQPGHRPGEREEGLRVQRDAIVLDVPTNHCPHVRAEFREGMVHATLKLRFQGLQLRLEPRPHRPPQHREASLARRRTAMREAKEIEALGLALTACLPVGRRIAAKFQEPRLVGVQC